ncbi:Hypothetical protein CAP_0467 [Chondromyces apiculatus DSM 436]|uniref:Uncharacterized protein n=1 Tax=Chondromyces apiculatus DSM 436 TaxID=1192034 RepID=A0A017SUB0_9BACT|nr:Hypothetical protein CAP_0467 [Chondromyces apiculatus DSM 436]
MQHLAHREPGLSPDRSVARLQRSPEHRLLRHQLPPHPRPLRPLTREHEHHLRRARSCFSLHHTRRHLPAPVRSQRRRQLSRAPTHHREPVLVVRPAHARRVRDVFQPRVRCRQECAPRPRQRAQRLRALRGQRQQVARHLLRSRLYLPSPRRLLENDMGVRPAEAEGTHPCDPRLAVRLPGHCLRGHPHWQLRPRHVRVRLREMQAPGDQPVLHRQHGLDDAGHTGCRLRVPEIRFDRADQHRIVGRPASAVHGAERLNFDGIPERRPRPVRLRIPDRRRAHARLSQRLPDHRLLRRAVRRRQALAAAVLVHRGAADHRQDRVAVPLRVREALEHDHAAAFAPGHAVRRGVEALAPAVTGEAAQAAELHVRRRCEHHRHATCQRDAAFAGPQALASQVDGRQRGGACRVHGEARPFEAEPVRDAPRGDAPRAARPDVAVERLGSAPGKRSVVVVHEAHEHAGVAVHHPLGHEPCTLQRLPARLEEEPLLRIHLLGFPRGDAEERRIEPVDVVEEAPAARHHLAGGVGIGIVERVDVPALPRHFTDRVHALLEQGPEGLRIANTARVATTEPDDGDRLFPRRRGPHRCGARCLVDLQPLEQMARERTRRRVIEGQRRGQQRPEPPGQHAAELHRHQRVQPQLLEGSIFRDVAGRRKRQRLRDLRPHHALDLSPARRGVEPEEPRIEPRRAGRSVDRLRYDELAPQGRDLSAERPLRGGQVDGHQEKLGVRTEERLPEQGETESRRDHAHPHPSKARQRRTGQASRHPAAFPGSPVQAVGRQALGATVMREGVKERIRCGVVGLPRVAEQRGRRREEHEHIERRAPRRFVEGPCAADLRRHDALEPRRRLLGKDAVVEHAGRVDNAAQRVLRGHAVEERPQRGKVRDVRLGDRHTRSFGAQPRDGRDRLCRRRPPADEQEVPHPMLLPEPSCDLEAQGPQPARDEHRALCPKQRSVTRALPRRCLDQPRHVTLAAPPCDLRVAMRTGQLTPDHVDVILRARIEVDKRATDLGMLLHDHTAEPPERRLVHSGQVTRPRLLRSRGHPEHPQWRRVLRERLHDAQGRDRGALGARRRGVLPLACHRLEPEADDPLQRRRRRRIEHLRQRLQRRVNARRKAGRARGPQARCNLVRSRCVAAQQEPSAQGLDHVARDRLLTPANRVEVLPGHGLSTDVAQHGRTGALQPEARQADHHLPRAVGHGDGGLDRLRIRRDLTLDRGMYPRFGDARCEGQDFAELERQIRVPDRYIHDGCKRMK